MKLGVHDAEDVVVRSVGHEEILRDNRESLGIVDVEPVRQGRQHIHHEDEAHRHICRRKPRASERAP